MFGKKCPHEWEKLVETTLPSAYEQMEQGKTIFETMKGVRLFQKKLVVVLICCKCGKVRKIVESNPDA